MTLCLRQFLPLCVVLMFVTVAAAYYVSVYEGFDRGFDAGFKSGYNTSQTKEWLEGFNAGYETNQSGSWLQGYEYGYDKGYGVAKGYYMPPDPRDPARP